MCEKIFRYNYEHRHIDISLKVPYYESFEELAYLVIKRHGLPIHLDADLISSLKEASEKFTLEYYDDSIYDLIENFTYNPDDIEELSKQWEQLLREETVEHSDNGCASDDQLFATAYHKLVHSPALETMFQVEHMYAQTVKECFDLRNEQITEMTERQTDEMNIALERLEDGITETEINDISTQHFDDQTLLQVQLTSELETIKEAQRREYREWLMQLLEQKQANSLLPTPKNSPLTPILFEPTPSIGQEKSLRSNVLEESFTIHLGSQLKQMHNIRILSRNAIDLCARQDSGEMCPQFLQTALGLYSHDLTGLVLMTDNVIGSRFTKDFVQVCQTSTEFHFADIDNQLENISDAYQKYRKKLNSTRNSKLLQLGDVYITKHSNLSNVHVIFHVVTDESVGGTNINSRHPVLLGLRNILKTACSNDVTAITVPLLLQYEMSEEMTVSWCAKRAELVFKCVKGFMIEMASWGRSDLKTVQFLVPEGISSDVFQCLTAMLPNIFKVSTPLVLTSNSGLGK